MMRPQRDTRFSPDKTPYKSHLGIPFRHRAGKDVHAPGLYVHIAHDEVFYGLGLYRPASKDLKAIRQRISQEPDAWTAIVDDPGLTGAWTFGDADNVLKTKPRGFSADDPMIDWLRQKSHILIHHPDPEEPFEPGFVEALGERLAAGQRYAAFLCEALGQPW